MSRRSYAEVELDVIRWAEARRIIPNATPQSILLEAFGEMGALPDALALPDMDHVQDQVGSTLVKLIILCALLDIDMVNCLADAYDWVVEREELLADQATEKESG